MLLSFESHQKLGIMQGGRGQDVVGDMLVNDFQSGKQSVGTNTRMRCHRKATVTIGAELTDYYPKFII